MAEISRHQHKAKVTWMSRGEIYLVRFDPSVGHEIQKTRPALVIQNDIGNQYSQVTIVAAITSNISGETYPVEVVIEPAKTNGLSTRSKIKLNQIGTVDRQRLIKRLGAVKDETMNQVDQAIRVSLGLVAR